MPDGVGHRGHRDAGGCGLQRVGGARVERDAWLRRVRVQKVHLPGHAGGRVSTNTGHDRVTLQYKCWKRRTPGYEPRDIAESLGEGGQATRGQDLNPEAVWGNGGARI